MITQLTIFQTAITGLKGAADIAVSLSNLKTMSEVQAKAVELQQIILSSQSSALAAQSEQFSLLDKIRCLEEELADVKAWEIEKQKYELKEIITGVFAYSLKEEASIAEPAHYICANCYQNHNKSILQKEIRNPGMNHHLICHGCNADIVTSGQAESGPKTKVNFRKPVGGNWMG